MLKTTQIKIMKAGGCHVVLLSRWHDLLIDAIFLM